MMSFDHWPGQQIPVMMVPSQRNQPCAAQSRQADAWDNSMFWQDFDQQQSRQQCPNSRASGCKRGGRPVTWIGGGGMDPKKLAGLGVPMLRTLFAQVFGQETASNNAAWLRRKLAEAPDSVHGQRRSPVVRARDQGAAIWNQDFMDELTQQRQQQGFEQADEQQGSAHPCQPEAGACEGLGAQLAAQLLQQQQQASAFTSASMLAASAGAEACLQGGVQLTSAVMGSIAEGRAMVCSPSDSPGLQRQRHWDHTGGITQCSSKPSSPSTLGKRGRPGSLSRSSSDRSSSPTTLHGAGSCHAAAPLARDTISDCCCGQAVLVYWPADKRWWEATLCKVNTGCKQLQLLYADMTEETVSGRDYDDMLDRGHLLAVQELPTGGGQHWPRSRVLLDKVQSAPAPLQAPPSPLLQTQLGAQPTPSACPAQAANLGSTCQKAAAAAAAAVYEAFGQGEGPWGSSPADGLNSHRLSPDTAAATTNNSSRRSTRDGFLCSAVRSTSGTSPGCDEPGNGSGNTSLSCDVSEAIALPHKRQCVEAAGSGSDPDGDMDALGVDGCSSPAALTPAAGDNEGMVPSKQQQQVQQQQQQHQVAKDPSQLGLWFASQQLQQLHLAEQAQHNLELQQQFSMQQQAAAHMQFRAAEQFMQQRIAATSSLSLAAAAARTSLCMLPPIAAPPNTVQLEPASPLAAVAAAAAAASNPSVGCVVPGSPIAALGSCVPPASAYAASAAGAAGQSLLQNCAGLMAQAVCLQQQHQQQQAAQLAAQLLYPGSPVAAAWRMVADQADGSPRAAAMAAAAGACCSPRATATARPAHQDAHCCQGDMSMSGSPKAQRQHHQHHQQCTETPAAAAAADLTAKAVTIKLDPETTPHAPGCVATPAGSEQVPGDSPDDSPGVFSLREVPCVSGVTAGCVSGFTGGLQGIEALDEVDTLLSRPDQGLFGDLDSELGACGSGHNDCAGCWDLLQMERCEQDPQPGGELEPPCDASGLRACRQVCSTTHAARDANMCTAFPAPTHNLPAQDLGGQAAGAGGGGFGLPVLTSAAEEEVAAEIAACHGDASVEEAQWGVANGEALQSPGLHKGNGRPNSALAHVFDYA